MKRRTSTRTRTRTRRERRRKRRRGERWQYVEVDLVGGLGQFGPEEQRCGSAGPPCRTVTRPSSSWQNHQARVKSVNFALHSFYYLKRNPTNETFTSACISPNSRLLLPKPPIVALTPKPTNPVRLTMPPAPPSLRPQLRFFSTSPARANGTITTIKKLVIENGPVPSHPYPARTTYKQSNHGLYGGTHIQYGHNVSEKNEIKTRRFWRPNIQTKRVWSEALGQFVRVRVQARVLRTIDKVGGLDEYLLGSKPQRIKELGLGGWTLRWAIINTDAVQRRFKDERGRLGVPEMTTEARINLRDAVRAIDKDGDEAKRVVAERNLARADRIRAKLVGQTGGEESQVRATSTALVPVLHAKS